MTAAERVLLTGATGFVGRALYPQLVTFGYDVRCGSRRPVPARWALPGRHFVPFEAHDPAATAAALEGCTVAYYLVHALGEGERDYEQREVEAATTFIEAATRAGVRRVVYLGGMRPAGTPSKHLRSRLRTGAILRSAPLSTIELRAGMVVGHGSASWRIVRDLAARLPAMLVPPWLQHRSEPVALGDVTAALVAAASDLRDDSAVFAVPGPDRLSAGEILRTTARLQGLTPKHWAVPWFPARWSSRVVTAVTRADPFVAGELVAGLTSDIVCDDCRRYWPVMGDHRLVGFEEAARRALAVEAPLLPLRSRLVERLVRLVARRLSAAAEIEATAGDG